MKPAEHPKRIDKGEKLRRLELDGPAAKKVALGAAIGLGVLILGASFAIDAWRKAWV